MKSTEHETAVVCGLLLLHSVYKIIMWEEKLETFVAGKIKNRTD
jgi:hypothetical protein